MQNSTTTPIDHRAPLFSLGQVVSTPAALRLLEQYKTSAFDLLTRHMKGDWGEISHEDAVANILALSKGNRILSSYSLGGSDRIWILTEHDRSSTTLLLPSEY